MASSSLPISPGGRLQLVRARARSRRYARATGVLGLVFGGLGYIAAMVSFTWDVAWLPAGLGVVLSSLSRSRDRRSKVAVVGVVVSYAALVVTAVVAVTASLGALTV